MRKVKVFDVYGTGMTRNEIASEKVRPGLFTGKWHGVYYYRGVKWVGPTNAIGQGKIAMFRDPGVAGVVLAPDTQREGVGERVSFDVPPPRKLAPNQRRVGPGAGPQLPTTVMLAQAGR